MPPRTFRRPAKRAGLRGRGKQQRQAGKSNGGGATKKKIVPSARAPLNSEIMALRKRAGRLEDFNPEDKAEVIEIQGKIFELFHEKKLLGPYLIRLAEIYRKYATINELKVKAKEFPHL